MRRLAVAAFCTVPTTIPPLTWIKELRIRAIKLILGIMRLSRRSSFRAAFAALAGMLFLQAAFAFAACELPRHSAAMALAMQQSDMPDCHEADRNANLCLAHCQSEEQTIGKAQLSLPDLSLHAAPSVRPQQPAPRIERLPAPPVRAASGPPPRILFQSLLL